MMTAAFLGPPDPSHFFNPYAIPLTPRSPHGDSSTACNTPKVSDASTFPSTGPSSCEGSPHAPSIGWQQLRPGRMGRGGGHAPLTQRVEQAVNRQSSLALRRAFTEQATRELQPIILISANDLVVKAEQIVATLPYEKNQLESIHGLTRDLFKFAEQCRDKNSGMSIAQRVVNLPNGFERFNVALSFIENFLLTRRLRALSENLIVAAQHFAVIQLVENKVVTSASPCQGSGHK